MARSSGHAPSTRSIASGGPLGLQPHRSETFKLSSDPFRGVEKARRHRAVACIWRRRIVPWFSVSTKRGSRPWTGPSPGSCRCAGQAERRRARLQAPRHDLSLRGPRHRHGKRSSANVSRAMRLPESSAKFLDLVEANVPARPRHRASLHGQRTATSHKTSAGDPRLAHRQTAALAGPFRTPTRRLLAHTRSTRLGSGC